MHIHIGRTWEGRPLAQPAARLEVRPGPEWWEIRVDATFHGDPPPPGPPGPTPRLWEHEVVELFLARGTRYTEIELGPHGHHLVLQLDGVRQVARDLLPLEYTARVEGDRWVGQARIAARLLPEPPGTFNAYAIHGGGEGRRYLAAHPVPGDGPDFHRLAHFAPWPGLP